MKHVIEFEGSTIKTAGSINSENMKALLLLSKDKNYEGYNRFEQDTEYSLSNGDSIIFTNPVTVDEMGALHPLKKETIEENKNRIEKAKISRCGALTEVFGCEETFLEQLSGFKNVIEQLINIQNSECLTETMEFKTIEGKLETQTISDFINNVILWRLNILIKRPYPKKPDTLLPSDDDLIGKTVAAFLNVMQKEVEPTQSTTPENTKALYIEWFKHLVILQSYQDPVQHILRRLLASASDTFDKRSLDNKIKEGFANLFQRIARYVMPWEAMLKAHKELPNTKESIKLQKNIEQIVALYKKGAAQTNNTINIVERTKKQYILTLIESKKALPKELVSRNLYIWFSEENEKTLEYALVNQGASQYGNIAIKELPALESLVKIPCLQVQLTPYLSSYSLLELISKTWNSRPHIPPSIDWCNFLELAPVEGGLELDKVFLSWLKTRVQPGFSIQQKNNISSLIKDIGSQKRERSQSEMMPPKKELPPEIIISPRQIIEKQSNVREKINLFDKFFSEIQNNLLENDSQTEEPKETKPFQKKISLPENIRLPSQDIKKPISPISPHPDSPTKPKEEMSSTPRKTSQPSFLMELQAKQAQLSKQPSLSSSPVPKEDIKNAPLSPNKKN